MRTRRKNSKKEATPSKPKNNVYGIYPDGVKIVIDWDSLEPGMSMFIPAINTDRLNLLVRKIATDKNMKLKGVERIEGGLLGMRFWRMR